MFSIFKKEVYIYFLTPFGYVFGGLFVLLCGIIFTFYNLNGGRADILGMLGVLNIVSIVIFPVLTMKLLAEEKKTATDQLLFTTPTSVVAIVLGKYFAALFVFIITLATSFIFALFTFIFGKTSMGSILGSYLGFLLLGSAYIAICLFASSLTENQVTAAIAGFGFLFGFMIIGMLSSSMPTPWLKTIVQSLAISTKYSEFSSGILSISPLVYYVSFSVAFLFFTVMVIQHRQKDKEA